MEADQFKEINEKLNILINLMGAQIAYGKEYREQVELLSNVGIANKEIAKLTGKTAKNVQVTLHLIRKSKKRGEKKNAKKK